MKKWLVPVAFAACCLPLLWIALQFATDGLGANPIEAVLNDLGYTAFVLLALTLACTPLQLVLKWNWPIRIRKLLGDFCFFYACLHLLTYTVTAQAAADASLEAVCYGYVPLFAADGLHEYKLRFGYEMVPHRSSIQLHGVVKAVLDHPLGRAAVRAARRLWHSDQHLETIQTVLEGARASGRG